MSYVIFRYLHFFSVFAFAGALVIENMAIKPTITGEDARNLAKVDAVYGIAAGCVILFGAILWLWVGKPADFYTDNPVFLAKMALFILLALAAIYPAIFFFKHRQSTSAAIAVPGALRAILKAELALLCLIPILAMLMTRGIGL